MSEDQNDGFYWEPVPDFPLRQGDLLWNVPTTVIPNEPTFVLRAEDGSEGEFQKFDFFPDEATMELVAEARWHALTMVVTPTCHISEEEKDEDIVAVVPVEPLRLVVSANEAKAIRAGKEPLHLFHLPRTGLGTNAIPWDAVAQLDRPTSLLKHELRQYRKLGLYVDTRFELRKKLASFWARASASDNLDKTLEALKANEVQLDRIE